MRNVKEEINEIINDSRVVLFMKGTPFQPACGFSARVVAVLKANGFAPSTYRYVNVLEDELMREEIKSFSQWPTIPQLYINGDFIGGSDIVYELHQEGELEKILKS